MSESVSECWPSMPSWHPRHLLPENKLVNTKILFLDSDPGTGKVAGGLSFPGFRGVRGKSYDFCGFMAILPIWSDS